MLPIVTFRTDKEMNRRKDMIANLRSKVNQMSSALTSHSGNRDSLLGPEINKADAMGRTVGLDNYGLVGLQRQVMKGKFLNLFRTQTVLFFFLFFLSWNGFQNMELYFISRYTFSEQDEGLEKLEETVVSTKHIALAVNEELTLHTRLIVRYFIGIILCLTLPM